MTSALAARILLGPELQSDLIAVLDDIAIYRRLCPAIDEQAQDPWAAIGAGVTILVGPVPQQLD